MAALLHDAPEYVIGDMISPVKAAVGPDYRALDDRLTTAVHVRFGLPASLPVRVKQQIKKADRVSAWMEASQIAGFSETEASRFFGRPDAALMEGLAFCCARRSRYGPSLPNAMRRCCARWHDPCPPCRGA